MARRIEYSLDLADFDQHILAMSATGLILRAVQPQDADQLAELMNEAYRETIDYDGETLEDVIGNQRSCSK